MQQLKEEINKCIEKDFALDFVLPTEQELEVMRRINRERSEEEVERIAAADRQIKELIEGLESGGLDPELLPRMQRLANLIKQSQKSVTDDQEEEF